MKYAVCISGHMRTYDLCLNSPHLQKLLTEASEVVVSTWGKTDTESGCYSATSEYIKNVNKDELMDLYKTENVLIHDEEDHNYGDRYAQHNKANKVGRFENILKMHFLIHKSYEAIKNNCDVVVRIRPDAYFIEPVKISQSDSIVFPTNWNGNTKKYSLTDIFFTGEYSLMGKITDFYNHADRYALTETVNNWHEHVFTNYLIDQKIPIAFDESITYQILRHDFKKDTIGLYRNGECVIPKINKFFSEK